ncbi:MAG: large exoprotein containing hemagglutination activity domain [Rhizobiaceae bacterium]|jgi:filamentous hemagglutinin family protein|nr:large exoprotein containing hemagglutination activity domain [Rhizobiaceae bacterium]
MASRCSKLSIAAAVVLTFGFIQGVSTSAQVATDGTVGPRVRLDGPEFDIRADLGTRAGRNLFHSFERFSLATGERATFSGPDQIRNLISRVTGGERSDIDGTVRSTIPGADFYFLNPAGVVFGPNSSLDLQGSFHVSTADELRFADGQVFSADLDARSSFTVAAPEAFGFLGQSPAPIRVDRSVLVVPTGESFSIVGGNVMVGGDPDAELSDRLGTVGAAAGQVTLAAVGGPGALRVRSGALDAVRKADVLLTDRASIDTTGDGGGAIRIRGGQVVIQRSGLSEQNIGATDAAGGIEIHADAVSMFGSYFLTVNVHGSGAGGDILISANTVRAITGELAIGEFIPPISADTLAGGPGGAITIIANNRMVADFAQISTATSSTGNGGNIVIKAHDLTLRNNTLVTSETGIDRGDAGPIKINATNLHIDLSYIKSTSEDSIGNSGDIIITAKNLMITDGSSIDTNTNGAGAAGRIALNADRIVITDDTQIRSSFRVGTEFFDGQFRLLGTRIDLLGPDFTAVPITASDVKRLIGIDVEIFEGMELVLSTQDQIHLFEAEDFFLARGGSFFGGRVFAMVRNPSNGMTEAVFLPTGAGVAGDIFVTADELMTESALVATESALSAGGRILIEASGLIHLIDSEVTTNGIRPNMGDSVITLEAPRIAIEGSRVMSLTREGEPLVGSGEARLLGGLTIISADSEVTASSTVEITGQEADLGSQLLTVEGTFIDTAPLRARCGARRDIGVSSFTGVGRGGLPPSPEGPIASTYLTSAGAPGEVASRAGMRPTGGMATASDVRLAGLSLPCAPLH